MTRAAAIDAQTTITCTPIHPHDSRHPIRARAREASVIDCDDIIAVLDDLDDATGGHLGVRRLVNCRNRATPPA